MLKGKLRRLNARWQFRHNKREGFINRVCSSGPIHQNETANACVLGQIIAHALTRCTGKRDHGPIAGAKYHNIAVFFVRGCLHS